MATTTNFGWETPDDTDLVKDGAAAMRTLGNAIDTSLVDLKGGTTGQILSKASNTDLDYTWINNDQGDITGVTAGTGLTGGGTSGAVTLDFDVANYGGGQKAAGKNKIINGDFVINQRNFTSTTSSNTYTFDRWRTSCGGTDGTTTYTPQTFTPGTAPVSGYESTNYLQIAIANQTATNVYSLITQPIEDVRTFAGQTVILSFWAKATSGTPKIAPDVQQVFGSGGSTNVETNITPVTLSTSWARYSISVNVPSISGKTIGTNSYLNLRLWLSAGSGQSPQGGGIGIQNNTFQIWGVQLEAGSTATQFQTATGTIQGELAACQRYGIDLGKSVIGVGQATSTTAGVYTVCLPVVMRATPTVTASAASTFSMTNGTDASIVCSAAPTFNIGSGNYIRLTGTVASGLTAGQGSILFINTSTGSLFLNAEL